jgi:hypothetical protein
MYLPFCHIVSLWASVRTTTPLYFATPFFFQEHDLTQGSSSFLVCEVVLCYGLHDVTVVELLKFCHDGLFALLTKLVYTLFQIVLGHYDALEDYVGLMPSAAAKLVWSCYGR